MRVVSKRIAVAFAAGKVLRVGNTSTDGHGVYLHENKIIERMEDGIWFTLAGWNTPTTRERIRSIAGGGVYCKDFTPYFNDKPISCREWYKV